MKTLKNVSTDALIDNVNQIDCQVLELQNMKTRVLVELYKRKIPIEYPEMIMAQRRHQEEMHFERMAKQIPQIVWNDFMRQMERNAGNISDWRHWMLKKMERYLFKP